MQLYVMQTRGWCGQLLAANHVYFRPDAHPSDILAKAKEMANRLPGVRAVRILSCGGTRPVATIVRDAGTLNAISES